MSSQRKRIIGERDSILRNKLKALSGSISEDESEPTDSFSHSSKNTIKEINSRILHLKELYS